MRQSSTMVEFRRTGMSLFLIVVLQFTGALSRQLDLSSIIREGDEVTLSCENVMNDRNCDTTTWLFSNSVDSVEVVTLGQVKRETKIDRLSLTANCSLILKKATVEDVGLYTCLQYISGKRQGEDARVDLSVVTVTEHKDQDTVTLNCTVGTYRQCGHSVKWLLKGQAVDKDHPNIKTSQSPCSATVSFVNNLLGSSIPYQNVLKCNVSTEPPGEDKKAASAMNIQGNTITTGSTINNTTKLHGQWKIIIVALGLAALITAAVAVSI